MNYLLLKRKNILFILFLSVVLFSCAGTPTPVGNPLDELDASIREASVYINQRVPISNSIAIVNIESEYPSISEYIINNLMENLVNDGNFTVVDRHQLDVIREELKFQMSGEVDDNTAQAIGRMVGAQTIILGSFTEIANTYRLTIRALGVETATIQGLFNQNISGNEVIKAFTGRTPTIGVGTRAGLFVNGEYQGELDLLDSVNWINRNAINRGDYLIVLGHDEVVPPVLLSGNRRITVTLRSDGSERSITYDTPTRPSASLFTIGTGVSFNIEDGVTLLGLPVDSRPLVRIRGGNFTMNGGTIGSNHLSPWTAGLSGVQSWSDGDDSGGAVLIESGTFIFNNGKIIDNFAIYGGAVNIGENATFIMNGGTISGNSGQGLGGGIFSSGTFTMRGGTINDNFIVNRGYYNNFGGGVFVDGGLFTLHNGVISGNSAGRGGGIGIMKGNFLMRGGSISGNSGCGIVTYYNNGIEKSGGIIYGIDAPEGLANRPSAAELWGRDSFIYIRDSTVGEDISLTFYSGNWERRIENQI